MPFNVDIEEDFLYKKPQDMYDDNKKKRIGLWDYQSKMIDGYLDNFEKKSVALELPTGSGKTLVGLLIGEFRRRKNREKVLFLCPTNQLVHQVVEQADTKFGIKAVAFCGKQIEYSSKDKVSYNTADVIGVTTYSSFFALNSFFKDPDILIMDDVHSCEEYLVSNWTVTITKENELFNELKELFKEYIRQDDLIYLTQDSSSNKWCDMIPTPLLLDKINDIKNIVENKLNTNNPNKKNIVYYSWQRIKDNLEECNFYMTNNMFLIRPWIAPTMTVDAFKDAKQRILMSATLGNSGELERITGIKKIDRLPIVNDFDIKAMGRRFFVFPSLTLDEFEEEVVIELQNLFKRSVILVPDNNWQYTFEEIYKERLKNTIIFDAQDIEKGKDVFVKSKNAVVILSNRYDGVDFPGEESHMLLIHNIPQTVNLQERFLVSCMGAKVLYDERIRTRIIQATGRCTRNINDYALVCIMGGSIENNITNEKYVENFPMELRAEINFGVQISKKYNNIDELIENVKEFIEQGEEWEKADDTIVKLRNKYKKDKDSNNKLPETGKIYAKLKKSAMLEVELQYLLWKKCYEEAFDKINEIIDELNAPKLDGYKCYWEYMKGCIAYYYYRLDKCKNAGYKSKVIESFSNANKQYHTVKWLSNLKNRLDFGTVSELDNKENMGFIQQIEQEIISTKKSVLLKKIKEIQENLKSDDGNKFESGHEQLGKVLGYISVNPKEESAPDPYWIIDGECLIVSEDKIYKIDEKDKCVKKIPAAHIHQTNSHETWIRKNEKRILPTAKVYTVLISNSRGIEESARVFANGIFYIHSDDFIKWACKALNVLTSCINCFVDEGDAEWRKIVWDKFRENKITPNDYLEMICSKKLKDI